MKYPHKCDICDQMFDKVGRLKNHKSKDHSIKCEKCEKRFVSKFHLNTHSQEVHNVTLKKPVDILQCRNCDKTFESKWGMKKHEMKVHGKNIKCKFCGVTSYNLDKHVQLHHNQKCVICKNTFDSEMELDDHFIQKHLDKDYSNKLQTQSLLSILL